MSRTRETANFGRIVGRKNLIINGGFDIWQRGTSFTSPSDYTADRWRVSSTSSQGGAENISRQEFSLGQTEVPGNPQFFARCDRTAAGSIFNGTFAQRIENVRTLAGKTVTISFYAKAAAAKTLIMRFVQVFGRGSGSSDNVITNIGDLSLGTSWQKYTFTVEVPSIAGKTIAGDDSFIQFSIDEADNFSPFTLDIAQVQIEEGEIATPFEQRSVGEELALCSRYYETLGRHDMYRTNTDNSIKTLDWVFAVKKRASPSVDIGGSINAGSPIAGNLSPEAVRFVDSSASTGATTVLSGLQADAEL